MGLQKSWPDPQDPSTPMPNAYFTITNFSVYGKNADYRFSIYRSKAAYDSGGVPINDTIPISIGPNGNPAQPGQVDVNGKVIVPARPAIPSFDSVIASMITNGTEPAGTPYFNLVKSSLYAFAKLIEPRLADAIDVVEEGQFVVSLPEKFDS
jgi:hypothetical protein